jgi:hypothetical protein
MFENTHGKNMHPQKNMHPHEDVVTSHSQMDRANL